MRAALLLLPALACTGPTSTPSPPAVGPDGSITVVVSSRVDAELEPCG